MNQAEVVNLLPPQNDGNLRNHANYKPGATHLSQLPFMPDLALVSTVAPDWATEIKRAWAVGGANTLQLARLVSMARKQLKRGWAAFWRSAPKKPFQKKKAQMLIGVARLDGLSEHTFAQLPRGWTILYHLGRLEHALLEQLVRDGVIDTELTLTEAKALVRRRGKPRTTGPKRPPVKARLNQFLSFAEATRDDWSLQQLEMAGSKLREALLWIDKRRQSFPRILSTEHSAPLAAAQQHLPEQIAQPME